MLAMRPSTVMILACSIDGWKFHSSMPLASRSRVVGLACQLDEPLVGVRAGQQDLDVDAAVDRVAEAGDEVVVGHEVGRGDSDLALCHLQQGAEQGGDVAAARLGGAPDALHDRVARLRLVGEAIVGIVEQRRVGLGPVVEERGPEAVDAGAFDPEVACPATRRGCGRCPATGRRCRLRR